MTNTSDAKVLTGDCLDVMRGMPDKSVQLTFCSPPYEAARTYGIGFNLRGQAWVDWCVERYMECLRVTDGLVAWVVEGQTNKFAWSASPALLMADLYRRGVKLRKPPAFCRVGIPGSGGPDWLRNDYEFIVCATSGKLPWSDNTVMGHAPKYGPGGPPSHRTRSGERANVKHPAGRKNDDGIRGEKRGSTPLYKGVAIANPGNLIRCHGGGGHIGSKLAHQNEAPFPEKLAEFFIRSFCPPWGVVLDPFGGSGTTAAVALRHGRGAVSIDIRASQTELTNLRIKQETSKNDDHAVGTDHAATSAA